MTDTTNTDDPPGKAKPLALPALGDTLGFLTSAARRRTDSYHRAVDPAQAVALNRARALLAAAEYEAAAAPANAAKQAKAFERRAEVDRLVAELAVIEFVFASIGADASERLVDAHPPTAAQQAAAVKDGLRRLTWNPETYREARIAATMVHVVGPDGQTYPRLEEAEVHKLFRDPAWTSADIEGMLNAAHAVDYADNTLTIEDVGKG